MAESRPDKPTVPQSGPTGIVRVRAAMLTDEETEVEKFASGDC